MANINKITLPSGSTYNLVGSVHNVIGTQTASTNVWTGNLNLPALYDGLTINYYLPWAGTSTSATLNLTLADGTTTGAKNCYYGNTTRLATHYGKGSNIIMTYYSAGSIKIDGTATTDDRWIANANYDSNSDTKTRQTLQTDNTNRPILLSYANNTNTTANVDNVTYRNNSIYANPSTGTITATTFVGNATDSTKLPLAGGTMTGQIKLDSTGFRTANNNGYSIDQYGNFQQIQSTGAETDCFQLKSPTGTTVFKVLWNSGNVVTTGSVQVGASGTITGGDSKLVTGNTVYGALQGYLPTSGGTLTGRTKFNNIVMPVSAGKVSGLDAGTTEIFKNGIAISNPATNKDAGWIRLTGTGESDTVMEIATGDDAGGTTPETILVRQYNSSNVIVREASLFDTSGNTSFPNTLTSGNVVSNGTVQVGGTACTMQFNTTTQSLDFIFA